MPFGRYTYGSNDTLCWMGFLTSPQSKGKFTPFLKQLAFALRLFAQLVWKVTSWKFWMSISLSIFFIADHMLLLLLYRGELCGGR